MKLKLSNTHDSITEFHESRVEASKSRREIVDKLNKVSEERTKLQATYDTRTQVSNSINQKLKAIQIQLTSFNMTPEQQVNRDLRFIEFRIIIIYIGRDVMRMPSQFGSMEFNYCVSKIYNLKKKKKLNPNKYIKSLFQLLKLIKQRRKNKTNLLLF